MTKQTAQLIENNKENSTWNNLYRQASGMGKNEDDAAVWADENEEALADEAMDQAIIDSE